MQSPEWPDENYPSLEDYKSGNLSDEWNQYFKDVMDVFSPWQRDIILTWGKYKLEAKMLLELLHKSEGLDEAEAYLKANPPSAKLVIHLLINHEAQSKSEAAKKSAMQKLAKDVKQTEKGIVKECWEAWQKTPSQYKNNTKFASAMIDKFRPDNPDDESKHLSSVKVITQWCADWEAQK